MFRERHCLQCRIHLVIFFFFFDIPMLPFRPALLCVLLYHAPSLPRNSFYSARIALLP